MATIKSRKRYRVPLRSAARQRRRIRPRSSSARLLVIVVIAFLAASVLLRRMLRPLHLRAYSHASRTALPLESSRLRGADPGAVMRITTGERDAMATSLDVEFDHAAIAPPEVNNLNVWTH
jgi:hypothetical protein